METLRGIITTASEGYDAVENTFTIMHGKPDVYCIPYNFSIKVGEDDYESIEVADVVYDEYRIKVYFGSMEISDTDEIAYSFNFVVGENSNSDSYSWEEASRIASIAQPIGIQYSDDGVNWNNRAVENTIALRFTHDGGLTWGNPVFVSSHIQNEANSNSYSNFSFKASSITIPVPYDENEDDILLIMGFCENENFYSDDASNSDSCSNADFVRYICMGDEPECFKVSSNGSVIDIPEGGLGPSFYGESVFLTIDKEKFKWYKPGNTYYVRARWVDSAGFSDWRMFKLTYDAVDMMPVQTEKKYDKVSTDRNISGSVSINFNNGKIQSFTMTGNTTISAENISNIPFGMDMTMIVNKPTGYSLSIVGSSTSTISSSDSGTYVIRAIMLDELIMTISEVI